MQIRITMAARPRNRFLGGKSGQASAGRAAVPGERHPHELRFRAQRMASKKATKPAAKSSPQKSGSDVLAVMQSRFEKNTNRHPGIKWSDVQARIEASPAKARALQKMEATGGEPDVVGRDKATGELLIVDCSAQSPSGRRSVCYDRAALDARKEAKPKTSAMDLAKEIGIEILTEQQYRDLQKVGEFDTTTSSWILTTPEVRSKGGALFCDRRYGQVFLYHNGAESYYAARGFRGMLKV